MTAPRRKTWYNNVGSDSDTNADRLYLTRWIETYGFAIDRRSEVLALEISPEAARRLTLTLVGHIQHNAHATDKWTRELRALLSVDAALEAN